MNGFEPLRRRIIDYTTAGQWSEVFDGPIEESEEVKLRDENAKLRELVKRLVGHVRHPPCEGCSADMNCDCSDLTRCDEWSGMEADARELGIEVGE